MRGVLYFIHSEKWANASTVSLNMVFNIALRATSIGDKRMGKIIWEISMG